jgi:hypothetical protein
MRNSIVAVGCLFLAPACFAQEFHHNNVTIGLGAAIPVGGDATYLSTAPLLSVGYGYRFNRLFQADAGFQVAFGGANNQGAVLTDFGQVQGGDHEYMVPLGGRIYLPLRWKRIEFSAGGGAAYLHYSETAPSNGYYPSNCYTCTSRGGWGGYGLANVTYYLDSGHVFRLGTTYQFISASLNGQSVGNTPASQTTDHWSELWVEFGLSF